jgi:TPR repeat protein
MSRFWKLHSSFRLNIFIAAIVLLVSVLGFYANALFQKSPAEQLVSTTQEDNKIKIRAQEGDADAALQVGMGYIGSNSHKNYKEAAKWLEQSARKNNTEAQYYYGLSLLGGRGVIQDYKAGFFWIDKAARKGHPEAQFSLGKMYRRGTGVEIDRARAYLWFNLAAAQGIQDAARNRDSVANHMALAEIIAMQEEAYRIGVSDNTKLSENSIVNTPNNIGLQ